MRFRDMCTLRIGFGDHLPRRRFSCCEKREWRDGILDIYRRMKAKAVAGPYEVWVNGLTFAVMPEVYAPGFFTDTEWFAKALPEIVGQGSLLEIGTGTGVIAICCARNGARVVATDLNPAAVRNAEVNFQRYGLNLDARHGNLYEAVKPGETFDFIFWAHPFNNWETPVHDILLKSGLDYRYEGLTGYLIGAKEHLRPNGKLLLGTGDTADGDTVSRVAYENGYTIRIRAQTKARLEARGDRTITYVLCEMAPFL